MTKQIVNPHWLVARSAKKLASSYKCTRLTLPGRQSF